MCGICGKFTFNGEPVSGELMRRMTGSLVHRGPDDEGIWVSGSLGLGHRRLSVIDLSPAGHQPMCNEDGTVWIVFNGEIYNFPSLRKELTAKGHVFRSRTDTETILHLYEESGIDCVRRLSGMFAFAIWDSRVRTLFLARDRTGKKPLYYRHTAQAFIFGSEIKAILCDESVEKKPDRVAIHHYLTYQNVPSPWTAFEGIRKLPPAHVMSIRDGRLEMTRYWKLSYLPKHRMSEEEIAAEVVSRLEEAVSVRMMSDVPLGVFLSGGIDSSAVAALMARQTAGTIRTFAVGFGEKDYNELKYAKMVAERFGTEHAEFMAEPDVSDILDKIVWHYNEPFADASAIPTYHVSRLAKQHVTVVLNGDGGDEDFAGYERYAAYALAERLGRFLPASAARVMLSVLMLLPHRRSSMSRVWKLKRFLQEYPLGPFLRNAHWLSHFTPEIKSGLYTREFAGDVAGHDSYELLERHFKEAEADNMLDGILYADTMMYLPDDLLVKVDAAAMAHSLEARSPFLDHQFMEYAARIPADLKLRGRVTKYILKKAFRGILPDAVIKRPKQGFAVPLDAWFRRELKDMAYEVLVSKRAVDRGYFLPERVRTILDEHISGRWNWQHHIWNLIMLELWHRMFIDG